MIIWGFSVRGPRRVTVFVRESRLPPLFSRESRSDSDKHSLFPVNLQDQESLSVPAFRVPE